MSNIVDKRTKFIQLLRISCMLCHGRTFFGQPICSFCLSACQVNHQACLQCGIPLLNSRQTRCGQCLNKPPPFQQCHSAFVYQFPMNHIIHRIKYGRRLSLLPPLAKVMADHLRERYHQQDWPEALIPVPLHKKRLRHRGFDQALQLAKHLHKNLRNQPLQLNAKLVSRVRFTEPQQQLKASLRRKNMRGAFDCKPSISYRHVAVIDDVVTTGETVSELSRELIHQGVERVDVWCLARTPLT